MTLDSLLLSRDTDLVRMIRPILEHLSIDVEVCQEALAATEILVSEKFDAVIVDCDDLRGGLEVLQGLRATPSNKNSVTFAILNGKKTTTQEAFGLGANFVLQKPISTLNASRCFRQPLKMAVNVVLGDKEVKATSTNISEGGIALVVREALPKGATPHLKFVLPGINLSMNVEAEVAWADIKGRVGCRFRNVPQSVQQLLEKWLDDQMEKEFPGATGRVSAAESGTTH